MSFRKTGHILAAAAAILSVGLGTGASTATAAARSVPQGFFGVDMDPWALGKQGIDANAELATAATQGVESVRVPLYWFSIQPYSSWDAVPVSQRSNFTPDPDGGAPYNWTSLDRFMSGAATSGIKVLPTLMGAPSWAADQKYKRLIPIPASPSRFGQFTAALASRYGKQGSFWQSNPDLVPDPISTWQIWNEPDLDRYWPQHAGETQTVTVGGKVKRLKGLGFAPTYVQLLRAAHSSIRAADPSASVMAASLTNRAWVSLQLIYLSGGRGSFEEVGANVFTKTPSSLVTAIKQIRSTMSSYGDSRLPYTVAEYSWSSGSVSIPLSQHMGWLVTTAPTQAKNAALAMAQFMANRSALKIKNAFWYTWASPDTGSDTVWNYAGMRRTNGVSISSKPVLAAFASRALAAEGCKAKIIATACAG